MYEDLEDVPASCTFIVEPSHYGFGCTKFNSFRSGPSNLMLSAVYFRLCIRNGEVNPELRDLVLQDLVPVIEYKRPHWSFSMPLRIGSKMAERAGFKQFDPRALPASPYPSMEVLMKAILPADAEAAVQKGTFPVAPEFEDQSFHTVIDFPMVTNIFHSSNTIRAQFTGFEVHIPWELQKLLASHDVQMLIGAHQACEPEVMQNPEVDVCLRLGRHYASGVFQERQFVLPQVAVPVSHEFGSRLFLDFFGKYPRGESPIIRAVHINTVEVDVIHVGDDVYMVNVDMSTIEGVFDYMLVDVTVDGDAWTNFDTFTIRAVRDLYDNMPGRFLNT